MSKFLKLISLICLLAIICICSCSTLSSVSRFVADSVESSWTGKTKEELQEEKEEKEKQKQIKQEEHKKQELIKKYVESGNFNKAIETGETNDPALAKILYEIYAQGNSELNIKKSLKKSYKWLKLASDLKDEEAVYYLICTFMLKAGADFRKVNNLEFDKDFILQLCSYLAENSTVEKYKKVFCNMLGLYYAENPKSDFELSRQYFLKADNQQMVDFIDKINENWNNYLDENTSENIGLLLDSLFIFVGLNSRTGWFIFNIIKDNKRVSAFDSCFVSIFGVDKLQTLLNKEPEECKKWFDKFSVELSLRRLDNFGTYHNLSSSISTYLRIMDETDTIAIKNSFYHATAFSADKLKESKNAALLCGFDIFEDAFYFENEW